MSTNTNFTWDGVILRCVDARTSDAVQMALQALGLHHCDVISVAGSVKDILEENPYLLSQIEISQKLHQPPVIVLFAHEDCGAYGGSRAFGNDSVKEQQTHREELMDAERIIHNHFPEMRIVKAYLRLSGEVEFFD